MSLPTGVVTVCKSDEGHVKDSIRIAMVATKLQLEFNLSKRSRLIMCLLKFH